MSQLLPETIVPRVLGYHCLELIYLSLNALQLKIDVPGLALSIGAWSQSRCAAVDARILRLARSCRVVARHGEAGLGCRNRTQARRQGNTRRLRDVGEGSCTVVCLPRWSRRRRRGRGMTGRGRCHAARRVGRQRGRNRGLVRCCWRSGWFGALLLQTT